MTGNSLNANAALELAVQYHQDGNLNQAAEIYTDILVTDPMHSQALYLLGVVVHQQGDGSRALELIEQAILNVPDNPIFFCGLGDVLSSLGDLDAALVNYNKALDLKPDFPEAHYNMGNAFQSHGDLPKSIVCYKKAIKLKPDFALAYYNMGCAFSDCEDPDAAVDCYKKALKSAPDLAGAHQRMGRALQEMGRLDEAISSFRKAVSFLPSCAEAYNDLGNALKETGRFEEPVKCFEKALTLNPCFFQAHYNMGRMFEECADLGKAEVYFKKALEINPCLAEAHLSLGNLYKAMRKLEKALCCYQKAVALDAGYAEAYNNLGLVLMDLRKNKEAISAYEKALKINPHYAQAHFNLSLTLLLMGNFNRGWKEYDWRFKRPKMHGRYVHAPDKPEWNGLSYAGKRLLIHAEQGYGDTLQFVRYLPMVKALGGTVIFEATKPLFGLVEGLEGVDEIVEMSHDGSAVAHDLYTYLMSLPGIFETSLSTIPSQVPYIKANSEKSAYWKTRIPSNGFKVGLVWVGRNTEPRRSCGLAPLAPLAEIQDVYLYGLQKNDVTEETNALLQTMGMKNLGEQFDNFSDTAGAIESLDLIISIDTAVAHLAGAMGKPVWLMLMYSADWRWFLKRKDSPWYPTMRIFRQKVPGQWGPVVNEISKKLRVLVEK